MSGIFATPEQLDEHLKRDMRKSHERKITLISNVVQSGKPPGDCWGCWFRVLDYYCIMLQQDQSMFKNPQCTVLDWTKKLLEEM